MRVEIDLFGDVQLSRELLRFAGRVEDASPAFDKIADQLTAWEVKQFSSKGRRGSGGWQALAPSTVARKLASDNPTVRANARLPLRATNRLMKSLTGDNEDHIRIVQPHQVVFGTTVPYARFHQLGEGVPRRRPLELRERDRREVVRTLQVFLVGESRIENWGNYTRSGEVRR